jgi:hypothetical protein
LSVDVHPQQLLHDEIREGRTPHTVEDALKSPFEVLVRTDLTVQEAAPNQKSLKAVKTCANLACLAIPTNQRPSSYSGAHTEGLEERR